jgi:hypothetical protein
MRVACERDAKRNSKGESGRCSQGVSTIRQRRKKGSMQEPYHERKGHTASARDPRHGRNMAYATVHTHIGLLTIEGASTAGRVAGTNGGKESE